jgi:hypothetical protein
VRHGSRRLKQDSWVHDPGRVEFGNPLQAAEVNADHAVITVTDIGLDPAYQLEPPPNRIAATPASLHLSPDRLFHRSPSWRAMSIRWTSLVPSPISRIFASR